MDNPNNAQQHTGYGPVFNFYDRSKFVNVNDGGTSNIYEGDSGTERCQPKDDAEYADFEDVTPSSDTQSIQATTPTVVATEPIRATRRDAFIQITRKLLAENAIQQKSDFAAVNRIRIEADLLGLMTVKDFVKMLKETFDLPPHLCPTDSVINKVVFTSAPHPHWVIKGVSVEVGYHINGVGTRFMQELEKYEFI